MPKNVMKLLKPSPHRARNAFDLSHRSVFNQCFGQLIPAMCVETVPGDHIEISVANLLRCIPLVTSPFLRAKQHVDLWFVPYKDLWHNFDNFITEREQPVSSALKYHNFCPHATISDLYTVGCDSSYSDIESYNLGRTSAQLLNYLGYARDTHASITNPHSVNLWRILAYQYIWYNEYRNQYFDNGTHLLNSPYDNASQIFNVDDLDCLNRSNANINSLAYWQNRLRAMCQMRYRLWKKDLFTGVFPDTQFGNVSVLQVSNDLSNPTIVSSSENPLLSRVLSTDTSGDLNVSNVAADGSIPSVWHISPAYFKEGSINSYPDMLALRKAEAVQIWRENALRAGNRVPDNMRAHYGVESDFRDHRPTYIGSTDAPLNIGDVMITANGDYTGNTNPNTNPGDIAGKGTSTLSDNKFVFDAKDFGVIMAISSILPEAEYNAYGIDRMNQLLETEDYFIPEYENLGMEPVSSATFVNTPSNIAKVIGYAPRYYGYKTKLDKCFGDFTTGRQFAPWCSPKRDVSNVFLNPPAAIPLKVLYVDPAMFDVNFVSATGISDQFLNDMYFDVKAVRPMSVVGLPFS